MLTAVTQTSEIPGDTNVAKKKPQRNNRIPAKKKKAAVYVDELQSPQERNNELCKILSKVAQTPGVYASIHVFGAAQDDAKENAHDIIAVLQEQGTTVTFNH